MKRGSVLIEVLVAVAILVGSGTAIMAAADRGERLLRTSRDTAHAADLARSLLSAIEAGLVTPQNAPQTVRSNSSGAAWLALDADNNFPEVASDTGHLRAEVDTEPTAYPGLARLTVRVSRSNTDTETSPLFTLSQLVRLSPLGDDTAGESLLKETTKPDPKPSARPTDNPPKKGGRP